MIPEYLFSVLEPPIFTKKPPSQVVVERGSSLSLCCEATGSPRPRIEWSRARQSYYLPPAFQENGCLEVKTRLRKTVPGITFVAPQTALD